MTVPLARRCFAEALGAMLLFACVIGSGVMAERLSGGNIAVALLGNTLATAAMLLVLVSVLGPVSGAHLNPAVTLVAVLRRELPASNGIGYVAAQLAGGLAGVLLAHAMFEMPLWELGMKVARVPGSGSAKAWRRSRSSSLSSAGYVTSRVGYLRSSRR